jgi:hypothetical protein
LLCFCVCLPVLYIFTLSLLATYLTNRGMWPLNYIIVYPAATSVLVFHNIANC